MDTDQLLVRAQRGDDDARQQLLMRHQDRLKRMIAVFLDPRVVHRVDASDILQETLAVAFKRLDTYENTISFYPWLRRLAKDRIVDAHRKHIRAGKRSIEREVDYGPYYSTASVSRLAERLVSNETSPSRQARINERRNRLLEALSRLPESYRELLLMRYDEQMSNREIAEALDLPKSTVNSRMLRALDKLNRIVGTQIEESQ